MIFAAPKAPSEIIVAKIIASQTQEALKIAAARGTAEEAITKRSELKEDFDTALRDRLAKYNIIVLDTSVVNLDFAAEFSKAVEDKQIAKQRAQSGQSMLPRKPPSKPRRKLTVPKAKHRPRASWPKPSKQQEGNLSSQKRPLRHGERAVPPFSLT